MHSSGLTIMVFVILAFLIGALIRYKLKDTGIPYSVALLVIGLAIGYLARQGFLGGEDALLREGIHMVANIDPHLILFLFLPSLLFESAFAMEVHLFKRMFSQIALLAVPGLIISTLLTALLTYYFMPFEWAWPVALMFGALISATDPVAVVSLLKEMSSRKRLETLIEGESLMNDGTAIVFFTLFYSMVVSVDGSVSTNLSDIAFSFFWVVSMGVMIGGAIGYACLFWLGRVFNDATIEIIITIIGAYMAFFIAEHYFHVSGVVSVVTLAIILAGKGRTQISPEVTHSMHHFWEMVSYMFNTLIFLIVGILVAERVQFDNVEMWLALGILYVGIQIIRAVSITILMPILSRIGIGIYRGKALVLIWGGLRGAVALALALAVVQNESISQVVRDQILFLTCGIVVLSIVINGSTIKLLLRALGLDRLPEAKQVTMDQAKIAVKKEVEALECTLKKDEFLQNVNWPVVESRLFHVDETLKEKVKKEDLEIAFKRQILEAEREYYWKQYRHGLLSRQSVRSLIEAIEDALDGHPVLYPREKLLKLWNVSSWVKRSQNIPLLKEYAKREHFHRLEIIYNSARGFIQGQQYLLKTAQDMAPSDHLKKVILVDINRNISLTYQHLEDLNQAYPQAAQKIETQAASRLLLNRERDALHHLSEDGVIDISEAEKLIDEVEHEMHDIQKEARKRS